MTYPVARLRISLDDTEPEIWRVVEMPITGSLRTLHDVIQAAMDWQDCHLWQFEAGDRRYGVPDPHWPDRDLAAAKNVGLPALIDRGIRQFTYTYDMGYDWRHTFVIESVVPGEPATSYPRLVAGERHGPPEDVGGFSGFEMFLNTMTDPSHEEHALLDSGIADHSMPTISANSTSSAALPRLPNSAVRQSRLRQKPKIRLTRRSSHHA